MNNKIKTLITVLILSMVNVSFAEKKTSIPKVSPKKIIVSGASVAQLVYKLGLAGNVIGRDRTSKQVPMIGKIKDLGMPAQMNAEVVIGMNPDLFIYGSKNENLKLVKQLKTAKIPVYKVDEVDQIANVLDKVNSVSSVIFPKDEILEKVIREIESNLSEIKKLKKLKNIKVAFIYARGPSHLFMAGKNTSAQKVLELAGVENAFSSFNGYKPVSLESVVQANPDHLMLLNSGAKSLPSVWSIPGIKFTTAGKNKNLIKADTLPFLGFVPSTLPLIKKLNLAFKNGK